MTAPEEGERLAVLTQLEDWLEVPMRVLGFVWLGLLVLEFTRGLSPLLEALGTAIWIIFILDFVLRLALAPNKKRYLGQNWLSALSLLVPALRVFRAARAIRVLRVSRAARGIRLVRVVGSVNRGMRALGRSMGRRGLGYVVALTILVTVAGAAGMHTFEQELSYPAALWWTAMIMTTMGSQYWPQTIEGRVLCVALALYAFGVFGYVTATLATFFVGRDAENADAGLAGAQAVAALQADIAALRDEIADWREVRKRSSRLASSSSFDGASQTTRRLKRLY